METNTQKVLAAVSLITLFTANLVVFSDGYPSGWGDDARLTYASGYSREPDVAIDSNDTIYVVWFDDRDGENNIYLKNSVDHGNTWSPDYKVTNTTSQSGWVRIAVDSNDTIHILWLEEVETSGGWQPYDGDYKEIRYKHSQDEGLSWSSEVAIATNTGRMQQRGFDIDVGKDDVIHVSYSKYSPSKVYYRNSTDGGSTWNSPKEIGNDIDCARPIVISADSLGHVYVVFHSWGSTGELIYVRSDDNGASWTPEIGLVVGNGWASHAHLACADNGFVILTYIDNIDVGSDPWTDPHEIYIRISKDYGANWEPRIRLTFDSYQTRWPITALDTENNGHIVWYDERDGNNEIYYTQVDSNGTTLIDDTRLTDDPEVSGFPVVKLDSNNTRHVFWQDNRIAPDNYEIFYKKCGDPPVADAGPDQTVFLADEVQFDGMFSFDPDGFIVSYEWDIDISDGLWWETGAAPDIIGPTPAYIFDPYGVFTVTLRVTDNNASTDTDTCIITVLVPPPSTPILYINTSQDRRNVTLSWDPVSTLGLDHFLIYRSIHQTHFDFGSPWVNTSCDNESYEPVPIPLRTTWNNTNAAVPGDPDHEEQRYYIIRAVNLLGNVSSTSRTVGKWTRIFPKGVSTFSLPLEPIEPLDIRNCTTIMEAEYIKYMEPGTHTWRQHNLLDGDVNNTLMKPGAAYEVMFSNYTNHTFCGLPGAMIRYKDDPGFIGFPHFTEARNLSVSVGPKGDVNLTWDIPANMGFGGWYEVYYSNKRDGFFGVANVDFFYVGPPIGYDTNTTIHTGSNASNPGTGLYYMVVPFNTSGVRGSSTYSIGIWTEDYPVEYDTFGMPLKPERYYTAHWFCDNIPDTVGMNYFNITNQRWQWHSTRIPEGAYDPTIEMIMGYQISTSSSTKFTFIGI